MLFRTKAGRPRRAAHFALVILFPCLLLGQHDRDRVELDATRAEFLRNARVISVEAAALGVTHPLRATLSDGKTTHEALVQRVNKALPPLFAPDERPIAWKDSYLYNYAAYAVDRLLHLYITPTTILRQYEGQQASFTWWVDDVAMDEQKRLLDKMVPPDPEDWSRQIATADVFDQLIFNADRNLGNMLITKDWRIMLIDHTRSFPAKGLLREPDKLMHITPQLLQGLRQLTRGAVTDAVAESLTAAEVDALLARRDLIVAHFR